MKTDKVNDLLLELSLTFNPEADELTFAYQALQQFVKSTDCIMSAIFSTDKEKIEEYAVLPSDFNNQTVWQDLLETARNILLSEKKEVTRTEIEGLCFILFPINGCKYFIVGSKTPFSAETETAIRPFADLLGKILTIVSGLGFHKRNEIEIIRKENMLKAIAFATGALLSDSSVTEAISNSLPVMGKAVDVDRVYLFKLSYLTGNVILTSQMLEWNSGIAAPQIDNPELQNIPIGIFGDYLGDLYQNKSFNVVVSHLDKGSAMRNILESQKILSILIIPIFLADKLWGYIGYDECKYERIWAEDEISILKSFCNSISIAVERARVDVELFNLSLFPRENPNPLFRVDMEGNLVLRNKAAENIDYFIYKGLRYSFEEFAARIPFEITKNEPFKQLEVEYDGNSLLITALLSQNNIHINCYGNNITQLKKSQSELERLAVVASSNNHGVHFTDSENNIIYVNEALVILSGYNETEIYGKKPGELFYGQLTQQEGINALDSATRNHRSLNIDIILYRKDKTWYWANVKKQPVNETVHSHGEFFTIIEDISEKKIAEENILNSERRLFSLIEHLNSGILLENENRRIVIANNTFCNMFGIPATPEQLVGSDCSKSAEETKHLFRYPEEFIGKVNKIIQERKEVLAEEFEMANGDFYELYYNTIYTNGTFKGHLWKYTDITQRRYQEQILKQQEEKYRNIIASMKMGLAETNTNDEIIEVNQQFCEMSGYSREEIIGNKSIILLADEESRIRVNNKYNLRIEGITDTYEVQIRRKNGDLRWWLTSGGPSFNDAGRIIGTIGISIDITQQRNLASELDQALKKAEESSNAKEAFLANMSHEIRTPLNAIIGMIREMSRQSLTKNLKLYVSNAAMASQHLLSIVNNVLDITKIESGEINLDIRPFSLIAVINDAVSILEPAAQEKMLRLSVATSHMLAPSYLGDSNRIRQILLNIISNSIKFTENGNISVECTVTETSGNIHHIRLIISDTGIGMDESYIRMVFNKFVQGEYRKEGRYGGTGLGLAITYELVQLMKGTISVTSKKDVGTSVEMDITLETSNNIEKDELEAPLILTNLKNKSILIVEDNDLNRLVALNSLTFHGMIVTEALNGLDAIEKLKKSSFDLILMDLQMPEMGGIEATRILREKLHLTTPVIALTANAFKTEIERCLNAGMNDYIIKPFEENSLMEAILKNISMTEKAEPNINLVSEGGEKKDLYNLVAIEEMSRGNKEFIRKIVQIFIEQTPIAVEEIKNALHGGNLNTVRIVAHRIKPNIDNFGIGSLKQEIRTIESLAEKGIITAELEEKILLLDSVVNEVVGQLKSEF